MDLVGKHILYQPPPPIPKIQPRQAEGGERPEKKGIVLMEFHENAT